MYRFSANIGAIYDTFDKEDKFLVKAHGVRRYAISTECPLECRVENELEGDPGLLAPLANLVIRA